jgi:hypothetical protein
MKIKELFEEQKPYYPFIYIEQDIITNVTYSTHDMFERKKHEYIDSICKKHSNIDKEQIHLRALNPNNKKIYIVWQVPIKGEITDNIVSEIKKDIDEIVSIDFKDFESDIVGLYIRDVIPQDTIIKFQSTAIIFDNNNTEFTLHNIHKNILECKRITFNKPKNIIGNVLGLLKIKSLVNLSTAFYPSTQWIKIVNNYISSKDLLGCQDELIENGLSKYAKL